MAQQRAARATLRGPEGTRGGRGHGAPRPPTRNPSSSCGWKPAGRDLSGDAEVHFLELACRLPVLKGPPSLRNPLSHWRQTFPASGLPPEKGIMEQTPSGCQGAGHQGVERWALDRDRPGLISALPLPGRTAMDKLLDWLSSSFSCSQDANGQACTSQGGLRGKE